MVNIMWKIIKRIIFCLVMALLTIGCGEQGKNSNKFSGFTKVKTPSDQASYLIDIKSIELKDNKIIFQIVKELPNKDYFIQYIITDFLGNYLGGSGTHYKSDGTFYKNIPEDKRVQLADPDLMAVIQYACQMAKKKYNIQDNQPSTLPATSPPISGGLGRWPWTSERLIGQEELSSLSLAELDIMRNEIFARHGWVFNRKDLQQYFESQSWYHPKGVQANREQINRLVESELTPLEKKNIQIIAFREKSFSQIENTHSPQSSSKVDEKTTNNLKDEFLKFAGLGDELRKKGDFAKAIENYNQAIALIPDFCDWIYNNRGLSYLKLGEYQSALQDFNRAIALNPSGGYSYNNRAVAYYGLNDFQNAQKDLLQAKKFGHRINQQFLQKVNQAMNANLPKD